MDILRFVNSKAIREHLREIGYQFDPLEAAWLIYRCKTATIKEKHAAWEELIRITPDLDIPERAGCEYQESLHAFLKKYMEIQDRLVSDYMGDFCGGIGSDGKPYVYEFEYMYKDGTSHKWPAVFSEFMALYESIMEPDKDVESIRCVRFQIDNIDIPDAAELTPTFDFLGVYPWRIENQAESDLFFSVFQDMWFEFPTPFKKGDIIWDPGRETGSHCSGPFVFTKTSGLYSDSKEVLMKYGDETDMCAYGYFVLPEGRIYSACIDNYMDMEYYEKEPDGAAKSLLALSSFLKGESDLAECIMSCHRIMAGV